MEKVYKINTDEYTYILTRKHLSDDSYILQLGGNKKRDCITITTYGEGPFRHIANLPYIKRENECAVNKPLQSGTHIIFTALRFIKFIPYIRYITLSDFSNITCDNGCDLSLACFYFVKYQQTWYEKNFNATLLSESDKKDYDTLKYMWITPSCKIPADNFKAKLKRVWQMPDATIDILMKYYSDTSTYKEFFDSLFRAEGNNRVCVLLQHWTDQFMCDELNFKMYERKWKIDIDNVNTVEIKSAELVKEGGASGGKKFTRKRERARKEPSYKRTFSLGFTHL